nr:zinc-ribbon domain-containing protein [Clostridiales bacterium]
MSFCTKCGKEFREGEMFCTACGTPISETVNVINPTPAEGITDNPVSVNEPEVI